LNAIETGEGELYFCVDGGGTRCRARLSDAEGNSLAEADGGPCNPSTNFDRAVTSVTGVWAQCRAAAGLREDDRERIVFTIGCAGTYLGAGQDFLAACPGFARYCLMSDGYAALIGAGGGAPCSLLIAGTGIAGHRLYPNGLSIQRDAWGWLAGDRGSASWIGQRALRHCLAALDGVVPRDALSIAILDAIGGIESLRGGWLRGLGPERFGAFAPLVLEQAEAGVEIAGRIRDRAVEHLAALIGVIAAPDAPLYAAGGLVAPLRARLSQKAGLPILEPRGDALSGCWRVAMGQAPEERALLFGEKVELA
jgi:glucosamine kinase